MQIKKIVSTHTADSKPVKQEVNGTVILPPLVFPDGSIPSMHDLARAVSYKRKMFLKLTKQVCAREATLQRHPVAQLARAVSAERPAREDRRQRQRRLRIDGPALRRPVGAEEVRRVPAGPRGRSLRRKQVRADPVRPGQGQKSSRSGPAAGVQDGGERHSRCQCYKTFFSVADVRPNKLGCLYLAITFQSSLTFACNTRSLP